MKAFLTILASCLIGTCGGDQAADSGTAQLASIETKAGAFEKPLNAPFDGHSTAGSYLASQFAQNHHDWKQAGTFLDDVMITTPDDADLIKRAMVLAMGAGDFGKALELAKRIEQSDENNALALLFLSVGAFHDQKYEEANALIQKMPKGGMTDFIMPLLGNWARAGLGQIPNQDLDKNSAHVYHAIMIADYLKKYDYIEILLQRAQARTDAGNSDREEVADIYAHLGQKEKALELYRNLGKDTPGNVSIAEKIAALEEGKDLRLFKAVHSPVEGLATALSDMAQLLYQENSDDSARIFAQMALYLQPEMTEANLLLAAIASRNERYTDAIAYYKRIGSNNEHYLESQRRAAELLEDAGDLDGAIGQLRLLASRDNDIESLIKIGDIYRHKKDFPQALTYYNEAAAKFGDEIPADFWHLYYVRGMSYEQTGEWGKAEADLKAALAEQPDHPYVLNYLGYAWADQGINLPQSLDLIKRAVALRPGDGYIVDSLGWVQYRMGDYEESVPQLEKAVELLPYDPVINDHLGDAYWQVGRRMEARFQWQRARNFSEDDALTAALTAKLENGIEKPAQLVEEARTQAAQDETHP